ncbi:MAG: hypothetical protein IKP84_04095 [Prevotella sp.]|nr:hypothetical protein [Prevotella sp.]
MKIIIPIAISIVYPFFLWLPAISSSQLANLSFRLLLLFMWQSYTLFSKQPNVFSKMFTKTKLKDFFTEPTSNRKIPATTLSVP